MQRMARTWLQTGEKRDSSSVVCHQCNGWHGRGYKPAKNAVSTCDNRNNECSTQQYCVKIIDPIDPDAHYVTFKSDCWYQTTIVTNTTVTATVMNKKCYTWSDGGTPPKQYLYCFCNDKDFCNAAEPKSFSFFIFGLSLLLIFK
uniref:Uncharacterized protein n=1 Tax=Panagrolaimus sp. JU765 TaxID=591449 RepID=A0AC34QG86_9BILA